jgi:hypothetical protein
MPDRETYEITWPWTPSERSTTAQCEDVAPGLRWPWREHLVRDVLALRGQQDGEQ